MAMLAMCGARRVRETEGEGVEFIAGFCSDDEAV